MAKVAKTERTKWTDKQLARLAEAWAMPEPLAGKALSAFVGRPTQSCVDKAKVLRLPRHPDFAARARLKRAQAGQAALQAAQRERAAAGIKPISRRHQQPSPYEVAQAADNWPPHARFDTPGQIMDRRDRLRQALIETRVAFGLEIGASMIGSSAAMAAE